jgi:hypothetical protein
MVKYLSFHNSSFGLDILFNVNDKANGKQHLEVQNMPDGWCVWIENIFFIVLWVPCLTIVVSYVPTIHKCQFTS